MVSIGIRVYSNSKIYYCIIEKLADQSINYIDLASVNIPLSLDWPEALNYTRNTLLDVFNLYSIQKAIIRIPEFGTTYNKTTIQRHYIEGVLQECIASSSIEKFLAGQISEFTSLLQIPKEHFKKFAKNEIQYLDIPDQINWTALKLEEREVILTANAALNL